MNLSSILSGLLLFIFGVSLLVFIKPLNIVSLIIGMFLIALGLYMILNSSMEDKIEQIKVKKDKK